MHPETPSDPPRKFIDYKGLPLAYSDEGEGPRTIVAVHGLPGSIRDFRWLAPALDESFRFIRVELPGFGQSARKGHVGMTIAERAAAVRELLRRLDIHSIALLGLSSGGTVVSHLAHHHPELVRSCAFIAANGPIAHYPVGVYNAFARLLAYRAGRVAMRPVFRRIYRYFGFPKTLTDAELLFTTLDAAATDFAQYRTNLSAMSQPCLVAWSSDDAIISSELFEQLEEIVPEGPRLRYMSGGHNLQKTKANEIAEALFELLA